MTTPAATQQQPVEQPQPTSTADVAGLAAALWQANTQQDTINILVWLLLLDVPTATHLVTIIWHVTEANPRPWRKTPASVAAHMQAGYVQNAVQRIHDAVKDAATLPGDAVENRAAAVEQALTREEHYALLHRRAQARRASAFVASKKLQRQYGRLLGWHTTRDMRTSVACALANGANYDAVKGPWPGTLHGGTCRCRPAPPRLGAPMVTDVWRRNGLSEHAEGAA